MAVSGSDLRRTTDELRGAVDRVLRAVEGIEKVAEDVEALRPRLERVDAQVEEVEALLPLDGERAARKLVELVPRVTDILAFWRRRLQPTLERALSPQEPPES